MVEDVLLRLILGILCILFVLKCVWCTTQTSGGNREAERKVQSKLKVNTGDEICISPGGSKFHVSPKCWGLRKAGELQRKEACKVCMPSPKWIKPFCKVSIGVSRAYGVRSLEVSRVSPRWKGCVFHKASSSPWRSSRTTRAMPACSARTPSRSSSCTGRPAHSI